MTPNDSSREGYFAKLAAEGYVLSIHGPKSGAVSITNDGSANLVEQYGLSQSAIDSALNNGASDRRLSLAEVLRNYQSASGGPRELLSQARDHLAVIDGQLQVTEDDKPTGPTN